MKEMLITNSIKKYEIPPISSADDNFWVPSVFRKEFVSISRPQPYPIVSPELCSVTKVVTDNNVKSNVCRLLTWY
jgi:hypothetical protein